MEILQYYEKIVTRIRAV